jgi:hypothetical protein
MCEKRVEEAALYAPGTMMDGAHTIRAASASRSDRDSERVQRHGQMTPQGGIHFEDGSYAPLIWYRADPGAVVAALYGEHWRRQAGSTCVWCQRFGRACRPSSLERRPSATGVSQLPLRARGPIQTAETTCRDAT